MRLKDVTLNTMATVGALEFTEVMTEVVELWSRVENTNERLYEWNETERDSNYEIYKAIDELENLIHENNVDVYGEQVDYVDVYGDEVKFTKPERTTRVTLWRQDTDNDPHKWRIMIYRDPSSGNTKITAELYDSHGFSYYVKIL